MDFLQFVGWIYKKQVCDGEWDNQPGTIPPVINWGKIIKSYSSPSLVSLVGHKYGW